MEFEVALVRLRAVIAETSALLSRYGETRWIPVLRKADQELAGGDGHGVLRLIGIFGGMGSFNDLVLCRINHHKISQAEEDPANTRLRQLSAEMGFLCDTLKRLADL